MPADPTPLPGMVYATYDFCLLIKYRYRIDIAIFLQYRIDIVSNSKNQYRCITTRPIACSQMRFADPEYPHIDGAPTDPLAEFIGGPQ